MILPKEYAIVRVVTNHKEFPDWMAFEKWKEEEDTILLSILSFSQKERLLVVRMVVVRIVL